MWKKFFSLSQQEKVIEQDTASLETDLSRLPQHIAIIMDGNGRWAKKRGLMRSFGHKAGVETLKKIVRTANDMNIKALTAYAFSTENWKRPKEEVTFLMRLFSEYLDKEIDDLDAEGVKIQFIGQIDGLTQGLQDQIENAQKRTVNNRGIILNLAVNYGSRDEITRSVKIIAERVRSGVIDVDDITENLVEKNLYTADLPPVDLVIRPGGDLRISNFLLWQIAYAEFWFTKVNWPDFTADDLQEAILAYQNRDRRFGGLNSKI